MDIAALSVAMNMADVQNQVGVAVLGKSLDAIDTMGDSMVKMMEASVTPHIGQNIDVSV